MNTYKDLKVDGYERVVKCVNEKAGGFVSYIAIHNLKYGPALGGCRLLNYEEEDVALVDVLSLSRAMTLKSCLAGVPYGGGKSVIKGQVENKKEILKYMADFVNYLKGDYIIAEDVNINCDDLDIVRQNSEYVAPKIAGDPSPVTAKGVFLGIKESWDFLRKKGLHDLSDASIMIYGVGAVGSSLVEMLVKIMKKIHIYDIDENKMFKLINRFSNVYIERDKTKIMKNFDIFVPCALGGIITENFARNTNAKLIAGCANNQLENDKVGQILFERDVLYAVDYVINSGGIIQLSGVVEGKYHPDLVEKRLNTIPKKLLKIYKKSYKNKLPTNVVAERMALEKIYF